MAKSKVPHSSLPDLGAAPDFTGISAWLNTPGDRALPLASLRGKVVLITTHLIAEWNKAADRCLFCREGVIERELDPAKLLYDFGQVESVDPSGDESRIFKVV